MRRLATLKETVDTWQSLQAKLSAVTELIDLSLAEADPSLEGSLKADLAQIQQQVDTLEFRLVFSGENDQRDALVAIHAGAGGTDSQDWAQMLLRMYLRWAERRGYTGDVLDVSYGEEAGIKSAVLGIAGAWAYGYLEGERGVHRVVRLSSFDSAHMRHTSFALVEVLPQVEDEREVVIRPEDLRIDVFKASGHGGQSVQKTSTAVRITHLPSSIVVSCQNERSQLQNREIAMRILRARLMERERQRRAEEQARLKGEHVSPEWGHQIRSYILHPYKLVKDHRTDYEVADPNAVLDGDLDDLLKAYLLSTVGEAS